MAAVKMSAELIGMAQMAYDWGEELLCKVHLDSAAAIGVASRRGNGKLRHVKVGMPWIQERVEEEELSIQKAKGDDNPADMMTKYANAAKIDKFSECLSQEPREGRAEKSLKI